MSSKRQAKSPKKTQKAKKKKKEKPLSLGGIPEARNEVILARRRFDRSLQPWELGSLEPAVLTAELYHPAERPAWVRYRVDGFCRLDKKALTVIGKFLDEWEASYGHKFPKRADIRQLVLPPGSRRLRRQSVLADHWHMALNLILAFAAVADLIDSLRNEFGPVTPREMLRLTSRALRSKAEGDRRRYIEVHKKAAGLKSKEPPLRDILRAASGRKRNRSFGGQALNVYAEVEALVCKIVARKAEITAESVMKNVVIPGWKWRFEGGLITIAGNVSDTIRR